MIVRELGIENFRKFRQPIRLTGFDSGLNLVCEPNETGKSTVLEALRAVLFERHSSRSERILSFRPHGDDVAPVVDLKFEVGDCSWTVRKRFIQKAEVSLEGPGVRATGDEAEERLQALLGFTRAGNRGADENTRGALGLLWLEQGSSFVLGAPGQAARRTIEEVLAGEVGAVTGGRRTAVVVQAVEKSLGDLVTATGRPTRRLAAAQDALEIARANAAAALQELTEFEGVLARLEGKRGEYRRLLRDLDDPEQTEQLKALERDLQQARLAGQALHTSEALLREAAGVRERLETRSKARSELRAALTAAEAELVEVRATAQTISADLEAAKKSEADAATGLETAREGLRNAEDQRRTAQVLRAGAVRRQAVSAAFERLDRAEALARELEAAEAEVEASPLTPDALEQVEALERHRVETHSAATAGAATLRLGLLPKAPRVSWNGEAVAPNHSAPVIGRLAIDIDGVGTVTVEPPLGGQAAQAAMRAAVDDLNAFLAGNSVATVAEARSQARRRAQAEQVVDTLTRRLADSCPPDSVLGLGTGLDALRGFLVQEERPETGAASAAPSGEAEDDERWETARSSERAAEGRREAAVQALRKAEAEDIRQTAAVERAQADVERLASDLKDDTEGLDDEALALAFAEAQTAEGRAVVGRDEARRATQGLDEEAISKRRDSLAAKLERMREDRLSLVQEIAMLEERAKTLGGAGPASRAAATAELVDAAEAMCSRLKEEVEVLSLLDRVIREAEQEASRRYLTPITNRVAPYVTRLLPNSSIVFSEDYAPERLIRSGHDEIAEHLSKGTQEQLAVLTRIAFADLLIEKGKPASLVLDDALVFADDDRFETMLEILTEVSTRMQVIVLACRTSAYRGMPGNRIFIS
ncbi:AAA family ATPase [Brevundimonas nasdae]|uniref:AAA family ATPase n=1 Tax=Brevundimonas nasdae TaxID=172043 RepID=A0ACD4VKF4_9CAUL|nr:AAA family ATPase [Brevundimonas nasdae]WOB78516.1 AAA family ATPase [Brevundimonas nasdae]